MEKIWKRYRDYMMDAIGRHVSSLPPVDSPMNGERSEFHPVFPCPFSSSRLLAATKSRMKWHRKGINGERKRCLGVRKMCAGGQAFIPIPEKEGMMRREG